MTPATLEVCVDSLAGIRAALRGGANRIELCAELGVGGLTPSLGLLGAAAEACVQWPVNVELMVMLRPRAGHFRYSRTELECMERDLRAARQWGATGVVFGITDSEGALDEPALTRLASQAAGLQLACHRAFDETPDPGRALETLADLGFDYVLTGGGGGAARDGVAALARLVERCARTPLRVMVGGGVRPDNIAWLRERTGATAFHTSATEPVDEPVHDPASAYAWPLRSTSMAMVAACREALDRG